MKRLVIVLALVAMAPPVLGSTEPPAPSKMEGESCFIGDAARWAWDLITSPIDWLLGGGGGEAPKSPFGGNDPYGDGVKNKEKPKHRGRK